MVVDEGLDDFVRLHPEAGSDDLYQITFTPQYPRTYRVWTHYALAVGEAHSHGGPDDEPHHGEDAAEAGDDVVLSDALIIGEEPAPMLAGEDVLTASAGGVQYQLTLPQEITAGEPVSLTVSASSADGAAFSDLEPLGGAYGHLVGFSEGATSMVQAHPAGAHPHGAESRGGPDLRFETTFDETGAYRLFLHTSANGEETSVAFTVNVAP